MGNVTEIESPIKKKLESIGNRRQELIGQKQQLENRKEELISIINNNRSAADSYFESELDEVEAELGIINHAIKFMNHKEHKNKEKMDRYQVHRKAEAETRQNRK